MRVRRYTVKTTTYSEGSNLLFVPSVSYSGRHMTRWMAASVAKLTDKNLAGMGYRATSEAVLITDKIDPQVKNGN